MRNKYTEDRNIPHCIIVDIDGTLAERVTNRSPFDWKRVGEDALKTEINDIVTMYANTGNTVIVFSGRDEVCRPETIKWLDENNVRWDLLFMRPERNMEKDSIIKKRLFDENIRGNFFVDFVLDDRLQVCRMWHQLGLTLLRVGDPDADF